MINLQSGSISKSKPPADIGGHKNPKDPKITDFRLQNFVIKANNVFDMKNGKRIQLMN